MNVDINKKSKLKKIYAIFSNVFLVTVAAIAVLAVTSAVRAEITNSAPSIFGYSFSIVVSGSMEPQIKTGELICVKNSDISSATEGDCVVFIGKTGAAAGERIVHEVIEKGTDENGVYLVTKGVNNPVADEDLVRADDFVGKTVWQSMVLGRIITFLGSMENAAILIMALVVIMISLKCLIKYAKAANAES